MSHNVPHHQVEVDTGRILSSVPVSGFDWVGFGQLANWIQGHGGMLIPWCAIGRDISAAATEVFRFRIAPKSQAVRRVWAITMRGSTAGTTATVTVGSASASDPVPLASDRDTRPGSYIFHEDLASQSSAVAEVTVSVLATTGTVTVESIACYEETRRNLAANTNDAGVDVTTLRHQQPIGDIDYESLGGVLESYKQLDARRTGFFDLAVPTGIAFSPGATSYTDLFPLYPPVHAAIFTSSTFHTAAPSQSTVTCAVYAKVSGGTGHVRFQSTGAGDAATAAVTSTGFAWYTVGLSVKTEDLSAADGRRGAAWETVQIDAKDPAGQTLSIASLAIYRLTKPL